MMGTEGMSRGARSKVDHTTHSEGFWFFPDSVLPPRTVRGSSEPHFNLKEALSLSLTHPVCFSLGSLVVLDRCSLSEQKASPTVILGCHRRPWSRPENTVSGADQSPRAAHGLSGGAAGSDTAPREAHRGLPASREPSGGHAAKRRPSCSHRCVCRGGWGL